MLSARARPLNIEIGNTSSHRAQHWISIESLFKRCQPCNFGILSLFLETLLFSLFLFNLLLRFLNSLASGSLGILFLSLLRWWSLATFALWITSSRSLPILFLLPYLLFELLVTTSLCQTSISGCTFFRLGSNHLLMSLVGHITEA